MEAQGKIEIDFRSKSQSQGKKFDFFLSLKKRAGTSKTREKTLSTSLFFQHGQTRFRMGLV